MVPIPKATKAGARKEARKASGNGTPNFITNNVEVYAPIPIKPTWAKDSIPARIVRLRLTAPIKCKHIRMPTWRKNLSGYNCGHPINNSKTSPKRAQIIHFFIHYPLIKLIHQQ
jgi:hypothetical protein